MAWSELGERLALDEEADAAGQAGLSVDESGLLQADHHLMHRRRADLEEALHVRLRRGAADDQRVGLDEGEVLPLPRREAGSRIIRHRILLRPSASGRTLMNIRY